MVITACVGGSGGVVLTADPWRGFGSGATTWWWMRRKVVAVEAARHRRRRPARHVVGIRPHQEDFGKGTSRVFFSGTYPYTRDISVQAPYPYSVNDQVPDTGQSGSRRVSKSTTRTLDFEESDTPGGLLNGNTCHKSMRGKLHRGSVWEK